MEPNPQLQINFGLENDGLLPGSNEDCLYLNVYRPRHRNTSSLLPVAVWLHGGAFMFGSGSACWFGPQFWMIHGIVLVTLNYRLGPLGFLSLGSEEVPGNAGMLDQVTGEWCVCKSGGFLNCPCCRWRRCSGCRPTSTGSGGTLGW